MDSDLPLVALLSIKPQYAQAILDGCKKVEFRKSNFRRTISHIVIYATAPVMRVIGWFKPGKVRVSSPSQLWRQFSSVGGIGRQDFDRYYANVESGVAIGVNSPRRLKRHLPLSAVTASPPPQNYMYLPQTAIRQIQELQAKKLPAKRHSARRKKAC